MSDYVEEVNTALSVRNQEYFFESMDEVKKALEDRGDVYKERSRTYGVATASFLGAGIFGEMYPEILEQEAAGMPFSSTDLAHLALAGNIMISVVAGRTMKKYRSRWKKINDQIEKIERNEFDNSNIEFAYEIADVLEGPGTDLIHKMSEKMP